MPPPAESARLLGSTPPPSQLPSGTNGNTAARRARPPLLSVPSSQSVRSARSVKSMEPVIANYRLCDVDLINLEALSEAHSKSFNRWAYVSYYLPILRWLPQYSAKASLLGDVLAGATMASFQVPLVMSLATSLAKLPPLVGLYSVVGAASAYAVFGGVPVLVVGPLPSTAVLYGQVIEEIMHVWKDKSLTNLEVSATISVGMSAILLACGLLKWGFLDNIFSRALLKGFIGAMGVVMIINQFDIQLGLQDIADKEPHHTIVEKVVFAASNIHMAHKLTVCITCATLLIVLLVRKMKNILVNKHGIKQAVYIPELLAMVVVATILSYTLDWESKGVEIVGDLTKTKKTDPSHGAASIIINPFKLSRFPLFKKVFQTSFLCSILGFFDSTTATKALGARYNYNVSSNRELVALGMCNFAITMFGGLPSFGALGRSKVNILAGALTPMAIVIMAALVVVAIKYLLPFLYYLPECVLALSTTIIGLTVIEEVPQDVMFFWGIDGHDEIISLFLVFATTIFWNVESGVILAIVIAVVRIIKAGTQSRIHILGRVPNTSVFRNADELIEESFATFTEAEQEGDSNTTSTDNLADLVAEIQQIEGVLIIKIPEPLNFANLGALRSRLSRIEKFGTLLVHPSQPSMRGFEEGAIKFVIFDCKGMTSIDASATQTLCEIVRRYSEVNDICVSFARVPTNTQVRSRFRKLGLADIVNSNYKRFVKGRSSHRSGGEVRTYTVATRLGDGFFLSIDEALKAFDIEGV